MKQYLVLEKIIEKEKCDENTYALFVFGSVANCSCNEKSDIDLIKIIKETKKSSGIKNEIVDGIKIGTFSITNEILDHSAKKVPYLLHIIEKAKCIFIRNVDTEKYIEMVHAYFLVNVGVVKLWEEYYKKHAEEKMIYGHEITSINDVWNVLRKNIRMELYKGSSLIVLYLPTR